MSLITGLLGGDNGSAQTSSTAVSHGNGNSDGVDATEASGETNTTSVNETGNTDTENNGAPAGGSDSGTSAATGGTSSETTNTAASAGTPQASTSGSVAKDDDVIASVMSGVDLELREDEVIATDYARRAAIATQAKLHTEAMFEELETEAFTPMLSIQKDATDAYSKTSASSRLHEKTEVDA